MQLVVVDNDVFKFDDQSGRTWALKDDEDNVPVWVEIKDQVDKKEK